MNKHIALVVLAGVIALVVSFSLAHAFFASGATNMTNTFSAAASFPTATPSATSTPTITVTPTITPTPTPNLTLHVVINEVNPNGGNASDWVELFNPTSSPVDVSGWSVTDNSSADPLPSVAPIPPGGFAVIVASGSGVIIPGSAVKIQLTSTTIGNGLAVGGDKVILKNGASTIVDQMSWGTDTTIFPVPPGAPSVTQSISRSPNGFDSDTASDWIDGTITLGVTN